jgi:hypothetical protein
LLAGDVERLGGAVVAGAEEHERSLKLDQESSNAAQRQSFNC